VRRVEFQVECCNAIEVSKRLNEQAVQQDKQKGFKKTTGFQEQSFRGRLLVSPKPHSFIEIESGLRA
jgi:hypothetical protein